MGRFGLIIVKKLWYYCSFQFNIITNKTNEQIIEILLLIKTQNDAPETFLLIVQDGSFWVNNSEKVMLLYSSKWNIITNKTNIQIIETFLSITIQNDAPRTFLSTVQNESFWVNNSEKVLLL